MSPREVTPHLATASPATGGASFGFLNSLRVWLVGAPALEMRGVLIGGGVLAVIGAVVFGPAFSAGYVWDDRELLIDNPHVVAASGIVDVWTSFDGPDFFPMTTTFAWLEFRLWGDSAAGFHAANIALHLIGTVLLWLCLRRLAIPGAWLAALLFAVHPVNVASVAWVAELKNVLSFALAAGAVLLYFRFEGTTSRRAYVVALALFVAALLAKTSVVCVAPMLLLFCWWRRGRVTRQDVIRAAPWFAAALALGLVTLWFQSERVIGAKDVRPEGWLSRMTAAGWCLWFYVGKGIAPWNLSMIYPRFDVDPANPLHHLPNVAWLVAVIACWRLSSVASMKRLARAGLLLMLFWMLALAPVLGAADMYFFLFSLVSDHFQHIALAGTCAALAAACCLLLNSKRAAVGLSGGAATVAAVMLLASFSWQRTHAFASADALWNDTLQQNPNAWVAHNGLGILAANHGDDEVAIKHYEAALEIRREYPEALNNLGVLRSRRGEGERALRLLRKAVELDADYYEAWSNLGNALGRQYRFEEACEAYAQAIAANPVYVKAHYNLGLAQGKRWEWAKAVESFRSALELDPNYDKARMRLGEALYQTRQYAEAVDMLTQAHKRDRDNAALRKLLRQAQAAHAEAERSAARYR